MLRQVLGVTASAVLVGALATAAAAQETSATIRTHQGVSYKVSDPSLEVFYSIGEPKETGGGAQPLAPVINVTTSMTGSGGTGAQQAGGGVGGGAEERLPLGHSRASEIIVSRGGTESRIPWDRIRTMLLTRKLIDAGLPTFVPQYRYSASVTLVDGEQVEADYVNLGGTIVRGTTPNGRVDIPWEEVQSLIFER